MAGCQKPEGGCDGSCSQSNSTGPCPPGGDGQWQLHGLDEHLRAVGEIAAGFAEEFAASEWARLAGLWHDLGKYSSAFQGYIRRESGFDPEAHIESSGGKVNHSSAGALHAAAKLPGKGQLLAYLIAGRAR